jgi:hypothetical protein
LTFVDNLSSSIIKLRNIISFFRYKFHLSRSIVNVLW